MAMHSGSAKTTTSTPIPGRTNTRRSQLDLAGRPASTAHLWRHLGGPIFHDKLFFFVDYQGARQHRQHHRASLRSLLQPCALASHPSSADVAITNPVAQYLFANPDSIQLPNVPAQCQWHHVQLCGSYGNCTHNDQGDIKIDWKATRKTRSLVASIGRENDGYSKVSLPTDIPTNNYDPYTGFIINWTHVFSHSMVNEARAGIGRTRYIQRPPMSTANGVSRATPSSAFPAPRLFLASPP